MDEKDRDNLIYEIIKDRYSQGLQVTSDLDSKANNITGFSGLLATLIAAVAGYIPKGNYPLLFVIPIILLIVSAILGLLGYWVKPYKAIEPKKFINEYKTKTETETRREFTATIASCTEENHTVNDNRARWIKWASTLLVTAIGLFFLITIVNSLL